MIAERMNRVSTAAWTRPSATAGSTRLRAAATGSSVQSMKPPAGKSRSLTANTVASSRPAQKAGMAMPPRLSADSTAPLSRR